MESSTSDINKYDRLLEISKYDRLLKTRRDLNSRFDPYYLYAEDPSVRREHESIRDEIRRIDAELNQYIHYNWFDPTIRL